MKLYIFDRVEIVHVRAMATEIISHSFSILSSVESASIPCTGSIGRYQ